MLRMRWKTKIIICLTVFVLLLFAKASQTIDAEILL